MKFYLFFVTTLFVVRGRFCLLPKFEKAIDPYLDMEKSYERVSALVKEVEAAEKFFKPKKTYEIKVEKKPNKLKFMKVNLRALSKPKVDNKTVNFGVWSSLFFAANSFADYGDFQPNSGLFQIKRQS